MNKIKVIFDTDPGVDDAMALLFLYYAPEIELIGITTTHGNGTIATTTRNALSHGRSLLQILASVS